MAAVAVSRSERGRLADAALRRGRWRRRWTGSVSGCALTAEYADTVRFFGDSGLCSEVNSRASWHYVWDERNCCGSFRICGR